MSDYYHIRQIQNGIAEQLGETSRRSSGFYQFAHCPFCGKKRKAGIKPGSGFKCYSCERSIKTLDEWNSLAAQLATPISDRPAPLSSTKKAAPKTWQHDPMKYQSRYISPLDVAERWHAYKPISAANVMRYQLGYGILPPIGVDRNGQPRHTWNCDHARLTYANIENSQRQPTGFRGRQLDCSCHADKPGDLKWLTVAGTSAWLWNSYNLSQAKDRWIIIAENPIDGILIEQAYPGVYACAGTAGAGTWRSEWTQMIAAAQPKGVLIWYDNDLIGNPNEETRSSLLALWIEKMIASGRPPSPEQIEYQRTKAHAPRIAAELQALGVPARAYEWAAGTRPKQDAGQYLIDSGVV